MFRFCYAWVGVVAVLCVLSSCRRGLSPPTGRKTLPDKTQVLSLKSTLHMQTATRNLQLQIHTLYKPQHLLWMSVRGFFGLELLRLRYTPHQVQFKAFGERDIQTILWDSLPTALPNLSRFAPIELLLNGRLPKEMLRLADVRQAQDTLWATFDEGSLRFEVAAQPATHQVWHITAQPNPSPSPPEDPLVAFALASVHFRFTYRYDAPLEALPNWPNGIDVQPALDSLTHDNAIQLRHTRAKWLPPDAAIPSFSKTQPNEDLK